MRIIYALGKAIGGLAYLLVFIANSVEKFMGHIRRQGIDDIQNPSAFIRTRFQKKRSFYLREPAAVMALVDVMGDSASIPVYWIGGKKTPNNAEMILRFLNMALSKLKW